MESISGKRLPRIISRAQNKSILGKRPAQPIIPDDDETQELKDRGYSVYRGELVNEPSTSVKVYQEKPLPGVANEIESYPCPACDDKVFLTASALSRHGSQMHPDKMPQIQICIQTISTEWKKRNSERLDFAQRAAFNKTMNAARAQTAVRASLQNAQGEGGEGYDACYICNMILNVSNIAAIQNHMNAHKRNDELRQVMIQAHGIKAVEKLTCSFCHLVFTSEKKLDLHNAGHHQKNRKFVCKFCGQVTQSLAELNMHKHDAHGVQFPNRSLYQTPNDQNFTKKMESKPYGEVTEGDEPCKASCPCCNLVFNRPALLLRHVTRVHSLQSFSTIIESGGLQSFRVTVENSKISYACCDKTFTDREEFVNHRKVDHILRITQPEETMANFRMMDGSVQAFPLRKRQDGTLEVILPENCTGDEVFLEEVEDEEATGDKMYQLVSNPFEETQGTSQTPHEEDEQQQEQHEEQHPADPSYIVALDGGGTMMITEEEYIQMQQEMQLQNSNYHYVDEEYREVVLMQDGEGIEGDLHEEILEDVADGEELVEELVEEEQQPRMY